MKVYLTADPAARAARRAAEEGGCDLTRPGVTARARPDRLRPRRRPVVMADGAVHIDTTAYTLEEVIDLVVGSGDEVRA